MRSSYLLVFASLLALVAAAAGQTQPSSRPNIVLFYVDDLGWTDVACFGSGFYETPNVDKLAQSGMRLRSAYSNGPNCAPSRASLMSGQYTPRHGVFTVGTSARGNVKMRRLTPIANRTVLDDGVVTVAESLQKAGYRTATMGKWHLGPDPKTQGFDVNVGGNKSGSPRGGYFSPYKNPQLSNGPEGEYLTDRLTTEAGKFINEAKDGQPFFLYLTHYAVHTPIQAKADLTKKFQDKPPAGGHRNARYAAMIASMDESLGRVLAALDEKKLADRTVVIFYSDNGGHGSVTNAKPLRGAKGTLFEGGIRVPMIVRWPGNVGAASTSDVPVIGTDLYPTFLELSGASRPSQILDGESLVPVWTGRGKLKRDAIYWHFPAYLQGRFEGDGFRTRPGGVIRSGRFKLIEYFEDGRKLLFDLEADAGEKTDLASGMPEKTSELHGKLAAWRESVAAPVPTKKNPAFDPNAKPRQRRRRRGG
ncbi:MAG: aryl-sulfate sulfohydrolase [Planctomycetes bacterium]|nr:aryl-sulfate sulfohydrolase [Planctomycetota bacterium]